ncbi:Nucleotide-binding alpha-beta plait [Penicillium odoratum]|uniref:Nucleotide-binding alpha-beta plait n=1 Tax=Penicillium odoratum TaxID=1167516 RepID=UPI002547FE37|nr:Nucleotide-binding alpha-beta plait [Penicillium odoratum]KAJ5759929.1 Nucleotide-binding alpha-beta plait [Penicillium odoratum]
MNSIRQVQALNKRELEHAIPPEASWHADYRDTAYIYIGGLPFDLTEGDVVTICSQYGEPVYVNLIRDKETGKSKGFAFLKYEDQRSTDLAVDNLGGATVLGRMLRVDHTRYKRRDDEEEGDNVAKLMGDAVATENTGDKPGGRREGSANREEKRPLLKEEKELQELIQNHDDEDPMKEYLIEAKKEEVARAVEKYRGSDKKSSRRRDDSRERSSRHSRRHRSREREHRHRDDRSRERTTRRRSTDRERRSHRDRTPVMSRSERDREDRSPAREKGLQRRSEERSRRDRTSRSRSPQSRRHRSDRGRDDRR